MANESVTGVNSVIGLPGPIFVVIHAVALTSLSLTVLASGLLIVYLCTCRKSDERLAAAANGSKQIETPPRKQQPPRLLNAENLSKAMSSRSSPDEDHESTSIQRNVDLSIDSKRPACSSLSIAHKESCHKFHKWNVGERLVVYLAVSDLLFGICHILDHSYMMATRDHPPDGICEPMAFLLVASTLAQWLVVLFTAISACSLIVFGKKLNLGRRDWKLLAGTFGVALCMAGLSWCLDVLGPGGAWCSFDYRTEKGQYASEIFSFTQVIVFTIVTFAYGTIWKKIQQTARLVASDNSRYRNSAQVMLIFVAVFIFQWWTLAVFYTWSMFSLPPAAMFITVVLFVNLGGVYNCIAYTVIRRRIRQHKATRGPPVIYRFQSAKKPVEIDVTES